VRAHAGARDLASGRRSCGSAAVRVGDAADRRGRPVSVSLEGREGGADEQAPLVSDRAERRRSAQRPCGPSRSGPACGPKSGHPLQCLFFFFFYAVFVLYLNLCNKLCDDPKIMRIFV
jgi:hypothetical protein